MVAKAFRMDDEAWRRHANPWSVWTRFAAIRRCCSRSGAAPGSAGGAWCRSSPWWCGWC
ncbi:DUF6653 family protein [Lentzea miocenica]|uniref:DUF6653 family protein n=1 Tax=Lentzea miocenica TaxID=3095431 RepID=UPI00387377A8